MECEKKERKGYVERVEAMRGKLGVEALSDEQLLKQQAKLSKLSD